MQRFVDPVFRGGLSGFHAYRRVRLSGVSKNTPTDRGVCLFQSFSSLVGGHIPGGAKLIHIYQIYTHMAD